MLTERINPYMKKGKKIINLSEAARFLEVSESVTRRTYLPDLMALEYSTQLPSGHYVFLSEEVRKYAESRK